jgi:hypothetical protein
MPNIPNLSDIGGYNAMLTNINAGFNATISKDCKTITLTFVPQNFEEDVIISGFVNGNGFNINDNVFTPDQLQAGNTTITLTQPVPFAGVYTFAFNQGEHSFTTAVLASCALDCCLGDAIDDYMLCPCDPTKSPKLEKAMKIYLLQKAAKADLEGFFINAGRAIEKYNKALNLCHSSCGCGC